MFGLKLKDAGRPLQDLEISYRPLELRSLIADVHSSHKPRSVKNVEWQPARGGVRFLDVQILPLAHTADALVGVSIAFLDVTTHRTLEDDLERARRELETAYEELQSTVEELETTNEELQSTNEELETTNDELRERTDETLRANSFLASVLSSIHQAVVVVDRDMQILAWSRLATELLGLLNDEVEGDHLLSLDIGLPVDKLRAPLRRVLAGDE
jgi:two-component system CheB/CheR fusion protein